MSKEIVEHIDSFDISEIKPLKGNPRIISSFAKDKLKRKIQNNPEFLFFKRIVINKENVCLAGNQRISILKELGFKEVPVTKVSGFTKKQENEFVILDNSHDGEFDWTGILNFIDEEQYSDYFDLPPINTETEEFQEIEVEKEVKSSKKDSKKKDDSFKMETFFLSKEQLTVINNLIQEVQNTEEFKYIETFGNENSRSNALYFICQNFVKNS